MENDTILVTGGTGTLGSFVVPRLQDARRNVRMLSRSGDSAEAGVELVTGDLATGEGIDAAVERAEIVVHLAGSSKGDEDKARHLVQAASKSGVRHLVYISVVGADRIPVVSAVDRAMFGYFASKLAAERGCGRPEGLRAGRAGAIGSASPWEAPADRDDPPPRPSRAGGSGGCEPRARARSRRADLGGVPGRPGEPGERAQVGCDE